MHQSLDAMLLVAPPCSNCKLFVVRLKKLSDVSDVSVFRVTCTHHFSSQLLLNVGADEEHVFEDG